MKFLVAISCVLAVAAAKPSGVGPLTYNLPYAPGYATGYSYSSILAPRQFAYSAGIPAAYSAPTYQTYQTLAAPLNSYVASAPVQTLAAAPVPAPAYQTYQTLAAPVNAYVATAPLQTPAAAPVPAPAVTLTARASEVVANPAPAQAEVAAPPATPADTVAQAVVTPVAQAVAPPAPQAVVAPVAQPVAAPLAYSVGLPFVQTIPLIEKTQYHAQDSLGQAAYGHSESFQTHNAIQDAAGNKVGSYSYIAPTGQVISTNYVADGLGYRVASNALPVAPSAVPVAPADTPEVAAARAAHLQEHAAARSRSRRSAQYLAPVGYAGTVVPSTYSYTTPVVRSGAVTTYLNAPGQVLSYPVY